MIIGDDNDDEDDEEEEYDEAEEEIEYEPEKTAKDFDLIQEELER